jgi:hypothetical protein
MRAFSIVFPTRPISREYFAASSEEDRSACTRRRDGMAILDSKLDFQDLVGDMYRVVLSLMVQCLLV